MELPVSTLLLARHLAILKRPIDYQFVMDKDALSGSQPANTDPGGNFHATPLRSRPFDGEDPHEREQRRQRRQFLYSCCARADRERNLLVTPLRKIQLQAVPDAAFVRDNPLSNEAPSKFLR